MVYYLGEERVFPSDNFKTATIEQLLAWLTTKQEIQIDTETEGMFNFENKTLTIQLGDFDDQWVINTAYVNCWPLKPYLESGNILKLGHNLKFDAKFLFHDFGIKLNNIYDTFLAECILTNGLLNRKLGLDFVTNKYTGATLDKSIRGEINEVGLTDSVVLYAANDVKYLSLIREKQLIKIKELELETYVALENEACLALADIEYNGLGFNKEKWKEQALKTKSRAILFENELDYLVKTEPKLSSYISKYVQVAMFEEPERDIEIKWSSPKQVAKVFKDLGLKCDTTSEKDITAYQNQYPLIKKFIDYKKEQKLVTTYGEGFLKYINPKTQRVHTSFWPILETGRVSSGSKRDRTPNLQNLPSRNDYLNCFEAAKGSVIIGIDYSGQEARIAAAGSKEPVWINTFLEGKDLHSEVCKMMFNITDELVKTKPDFLRGKSYRDVAKTINFGVLFGMSKFKLSKSLQITVDEADKLIKKYFSATPFLNKYLKSCAAYGLKYGYIRSYHPYRMIRYFPQWKANMNYNEDYKAIGEIERASFNTPIQSTASQITKLALVKIRKDINTNNRPVKIVHVVHDAIMTECPKELAEEYSKIQDSLMKEAWNEVITNVPIATDITISNCWSK